MESKKKEEYAVNLIINIYNDILETGNFSIKKFFKSIFLDKNLNLYYKIYVIYAFCIVGDFLLKVNKKEIERNRRNIKQK